MGDVLGEGLPGLDGSGGDVPGYATTVYIHYLYLKGFEHFQMGYVLRAKVTVFSMRPLISAPLSLSRYRPEASTIESTVAFGLKASATAAAIAAAPSWQNPKSWMWIKPATL